MAARRVGTRAAAARRSFLLREPPAGGDHRDREAPLARGGEAGQRLGRLARVAGRDDEGPLSHPAGQPVVAMHDERHTQPIPRCGRDELGADGGAAHGQHDDGVDICVPRPELDRRRHLARLRQLARHRSDAAQHVLGVDALQRGGIVERHRLLEQRRAAGVPVLGRVGAARLLVGILVAEEVAGIHQRPAAAMRLPSSRSCSTSSGERAST